MKIAICGTNIENNKNLIFDIIKNYSKYITPNVTIHQEIDTNLENISDSVVEVCAQLSKKEKEFYLKMQILNDQFEKYQDKRFIIYNGSPLDVLADCIAAAEDESNEISDDFVEKMIYWNKKLLKKLDMVFWYPNNDIWSTTENEDFEQNYDYFREITRNGLYENYLTSFDSSIYFQQNDCPAFFAFETDNPLTEIRNLFGKDGDIDEDDDIIDDKRIREILKNPILIEGYEEGIKNKQNGIEIL